MSASKLLNLLDRVPNREDDSLSDREIEVLRFAVTGMKNATIAQTMGLRYKTIQRHRENINKKLKAHHPIAMVRAAIVKDYITVDEWLEMVVEA